MSAFQRAILSALLLVLSPTGAAAVQRTEVWRSGDPAVGLEGEPPLVSLYPLGWIDDRTLLILGRTGNSWPSCEVRSGIWRWTVEGGMELVLSTDQESFGVLDLAGMSRTGYVLMETLPCGFGERAMRIVAPSGEVVSSIARGDAILVGDALLWIRGIGFRDVWQFGDVIWAINDAGRALVRVALAPDPDEDVGLSRQAVLFLDETGTPQVVAVEGDPAPGRPDSCRFGAVDRFAVGAAPDVVAFTAYVLCDGDDEYTEEALYRWSRADGPSLIDVAPLSEKLDPRVVLANGAILYLVWDRGGRSPTAWNAASIGTDPVRAIGLGDTISGLEAEEYVTSLFAFGGADVATSASLAAFAMLARNPSDPEDSIGVLVERGETGSLEVRLRSGAAVPWEPSASFCPALGPSVYGYDGARILFATSIQREGEPECSEGGYHVLEPDGTGRLVFRYDDLVGFEGYITVEAFSHDFSRVSYCEGNDVCWVLTAPEPHGPGGVLAALLALAAARLRPSRGSGADRLHRRRAV